jgi:type II secretory pathway pseudopilin PulG
VELLTVISIVGILAATAAPTFISYMRDARVSEAASNIADLFRGARSRAMGRGSATMVRWNASAALPTNANPEGHFGVREAISGPSTPFHQMLPSTSCFAASFQVGSPTSTHVKGFDARIPRYQPAEVTYRTSSSPDPIAYAEICYTPRGRTFVRYVAEGGWQPLTQVLAIEVLNPSTTMRRFVVVPPNGAARLETRVD